MIHSLRSIVCLLFLAAAPVLAQTPPSAKPVYAILSLVGDRLDIVVREIQIGTRINANRRESHEIPGSVFDDVAVAAAAKSVRAAQPGAEVSHLNTRSPVLFAKHRELFDVSQGVMGMPDAIREALKGQGATHLVLITKHREDALFRFNNRESEGAGTLEGLGFYLDTTVETYNYNAKTGDRSKSGVGFIAPYAFVTVQVAEFPSAKVLGRKSVADYQMVGSGNSETDVSQPWQAMTAAQKARAVARVVESSVAKAADEVLRVAAPAR